MLPKPLCTFKIPSLHDGLELDGRLYVPKMFSHSGPIGPKGFAIFAHPYAPLGGSWDDPVVQLVGALLLRQGFILNTFQFRGARGAQGRTSWTAKPELGDYVSFYALMVTLITSLRDELHEPATVDLPEHPLLILGGYSYGSHIAGHLPPLDTMHQIVAATAEDSQLASIKSRASELAKTLAGYLELQNFRGRTEAHSDGSSSPSKSMQGMVVGGYESSLSGRRSSRDSTRHSIDVELVRKSIEKVKRRLSFGSRDNSQSNLTIIHRAPESLCIPMIGYLLVSPLLPPASGLTTMFSELKFEHSQIGKAVNRIDTTVDSKTLLINNATCAVYGSNDNFTSSKKLRKWATEMRVQPSSRFVAHEIHGAGHFWTEPGAETGLMAAINSWIIGLSDRP